MIKLKRNQWIIIVAIIGSIWMSLFLPASSSEKETKSHLKKNGTHHFGYFNFLAKSNLYDGRVLLRVKEKIDLSDRQIEKIENLMLEHEAFSIRNSAEIKIKELRFATYLKAGKLNRQETEKFIRDISAEKTDLIVNYINYLVDIRALLTSRQLEILEKFVKERTNSTSKKSKKD